MFPIAQCAAWVGSKVATRKHSQKKTALKGEPNARMPECRMPNALVAIVQCAAMVDGLQRRSCIPAGSSKTPQIVSATNTACNSHSNVTYLVSYWPSWTAEEGDIAVLLVQSLGLALAAKIYPDQSCEPKVENGSVGFSVSQQKVGRFGRFLERNRKKTKPKPNISRSVSRSVSRRNQPNGQHFDGSLYSYNVKTWSYGTCVCCARRCGPIHVLMVCSKQ